VIFLNKKGAYKSICREYGSDLEQEVTFKACKMLKEENGRTRTGPMAGCHEHSNEFVFPK
jgi:hypothetical protein